MHISDRSEYTPENTSENTLHNTVTAAKEQVIENIETIHNSHIPSLRKFGVSQKKMNMFWDMLRNNPGQAISFEELESRGINKNYLRNIVRDVRDVLPDSYRIVPETGIGYKLLIENTAFDLELAPTDTKVQVCLNYAKKTIIVGERVCQFSKEEFDFLHILFYSNYHSATRNDLSKALPDYDIDIIGKELHNTFKRQNFSTIGFSYYKNVNTSEEDRFMISSVFLLKVFSV